MGALFVRDFREDDLDEIARLWHDSWTSTGLSTPEDPTVGDLRNRLTS